MLAYVFHCSLVPILQMYSSRPIVAAGDTNSSVAIWHAVISVGVNKPYSR